MRKSPEPLPSTLISRWPVGPTHLWRRCEAEGEEIGWVVDRRKKVEMEMKNKNEVMKDSIF